MSQAILIPPGLFPCFPTFGIDACSAWLVSSLILA